MDVARAIEIVNTVTFKPGWSLSAGPFLLLDIIEIEGAIALHCHLQTRDTDPQFGPDFTERIDEVVSPPVVVDDLNTEIELHRRIFETIMKLDLHEELEWYRVDGKAVFHPHNDDGRQAYEDTQSITASF